MIRAKNTYVDINGIILNKKTYYLVTFIMNKEISLFGHIIKEYTKIKEIPFVFQSYEIAKDFCALNPKIKEKVFSSVTNSGYTTKYYTYELIINAKVKAYILWVNGLANISHDTVEYVPEKVYPIVGGFIGKESDITLPTYSQVSRVNAPYPKTKNNVEKLSDIFCILSNDKHHFKLIEQ